MKVCFLNPPWWTQTANGLLCGVRAGSRWPFQKPVMSTPNNPVFGDYSPYPFFLSYAATYAAKHTDFKVRLHDSIATSTHRAARLRSLASLSAVPMNVSVNQMRLWWRKLSGISPQVLSQSGRTSERPGERKA